MSTDNASHATRQALDFLRGHHMGVLSTVSPDGKPWGSSVYFVVDDDFTVYFVTRAETSKFKNLQKNPHVSLTVSDEPSQTTVQLAGKVAPVAVHDYMEIVYKKLASIRPKEDFAWSPPVDKIHKGYFMPLYIKPDKVQFANFKEHKHDLHDQEFIHKII